jgi:hypothetical protein
MIVTDERHARITFPLDNIEAQLDRLALLLANVDASKREIQTVNLLVQRNVPVTFVPPPEPDPITDGTAQVLPAVAQSTPGQAAKKAQFLSITGHKTTHHKIAAIVRRAIPVSSFYNPP